MKDLRVNYSKGSLIESEVDTDAIAQFRHWFKEAESSGIKEPNAFVLSTSVDLSVSSRTVLLKGLEQDSFFFYTNFTSKKAKELEANSHCAMLFPWYTMERQVKVKGRVQKISDQQATDYFNSRPYESRLGAWASDQSSTIANREELEEKFNAIRARFTEETIHKPPHWGGFKIIPDSIEFWQGRSNRMHDRLVYSRADGDAWTIARLQP